MGTEAAYAASKERSVGIDCLRAVAIIWVVLYHFVPLTVLNRGTFGVLLFFIISGYCIAFSVETSHTAWHFYAKRLGRLLPALIVCGFITTLLKHLGPQLVESGREVSWLNYIKTVIYLPTLNPLRDSYVWPDGAYWSLVVEFQFYAFCFLAMLVGLKDRLLPILCVLVIFRTLTGVNIYNDFFSFFIAGMGVAAIVRGRTVEGVIAIAVAFGVELYSLYVGVNQPSVPIEMYRSILLWCGTALIYLAAKFDRYLPRGLRAVAFIGVVSYPLYLIHQDFGNILLKWGGVGLVSAPDLLIRAIMLPPLLFLVAWLVYVLVEKRVIKRLTRLLASGST